MAKRIKVLCCCGAGMGTCMLVRNKVDKVLRGLGVEAQIVNESVQQGLTMWKQYDVIVCNHNLAGKFEKASAAGKHVLGLQNVTDVKEIEEKFKACGVLETID